MTSAGAPLPAPSTHAAPAVSATARSSGTLTASGPSGGRTEVLAGAVVVGVTLVTALWLRFHPGPVFLDHWGFALVHPANGNRYWQRVTDLRSVTVLAVGSVLAAALAVARDRWRALACLVAPTLAVVLTEYVLKPGVGRRFAEVLSFPSGTTTVVGSVAMAWVLAAPPRVRPVVTALAASAVILECIAVVALQWHYPSDALAGALLGAGVVVLVDGILHLGAGRVRGRHAAGPVSAGPPTR